MRCKICICFFLSLTLLSGLVYGEAGSAGMTFLKVGNSARAIALGDAFVAVPDAGAAGLHYNPAGASFVKNLEVMFTYSDWFVDTSFNNFSAVKRHRDFAIGTQVTYFNGGEFERRELDQPTDTPDGTFSADALAIGLTASRRLAADLSIGITGKFLFEKIEAEEAKGFAADLGLIYQPEAFNNLSVGFSVTNLGQKMKYVEEKFNIPTTVRAGIAYQINPATALVADLNKSRDTDLRLQAGLDFKFHDILSIRGGYKINYDNEDFTVGTGVAYQNYFVDYAFVPYSENLNDLHHVTLGLRF